MPGDKNMSQIVYGVNDCFVHGPSDVVRPSGVMAARHSNHTAVTSHEADTLYIPRHAGCSMLCVHAVHRLAEGAVCSPYDITTG